VRELENVIHRLVVMTDGYCIEVPDLPAPLRFSVAHEQDLTRPLAEVEADYIRKVLASVGGTGPGLPRCFRSTARRCETN